MENNYALNICLANPGLAIKAGSSALVKYANTFSFKANGRVSPSITTADAPSLALATTVAPFPNGTAVVTGVLPTLYSRVYSLIATLPINGTGTVTPTFSWLAGERYLTTSDVFNMGAVPQPSASNQTLVGFIVVANATGADFIPGTTALDVGSLTVTYFNNYAIPGK